MDVPHKLNNFDQVTEFEVKKNIVYKLSGVSWICNLHVLTSFLD